MARRLSAGFREGGFGDGPGLEDAGDFQAQVPVEVGGVVFVDDEGGRLRPAP
jgi:hypothetical protein